jgi:hypothetical protein
VHAPADRAAAAASDAERLADEVFPLCEGARITAQSVGSERPSSRLTISGVCVVQIDQKWVERNLGFDPKGRPFLLGDVCTIADIGCGSHGFHAEGGFEIGTWPDLEAGAGRLKAMCGFALPYDLIPSKDREFPAAPHYAKAQL